MTLHDNIFWFGLLLAWCFYFYSVGYDYLSSGLRQLLKSRENDLREQNPVNLILACAHAVKVICILAPTSARSLFNRYYTALIIASSILLVE